MRDLFSFSIPLGRLFGINLKVHWLFPVFAVGVMLRIATQKEYESLLWVEAGILMALLFVVVLLHELGHCFAARYVDGDAQEILMWPLGGLAFVEVPHTWQANMIVAAAGPAMNLFLALVSGLILAMCSFWPPLSPLWDPFRPALYNTAAKATFGSKYHLGDPIPGSGEDKGVGKLEDPTEPARQAMNALAGASDSGTARGVRHYELTVWQAQLARFLWLNWIGALFNLVLACFPLDGGRILQCALWPRLGFRQATMTVVYAGFVISLVVVVFSVAVNEVLLLCLATFILLTCSQQWMLMETGGEESLFGYDFSQGYTSLERDAPPPQRRRQNWFQRWLQRRAARRLQREQEQRESEERRMDELLEKVHRDGLHALTDEERRFLKKTSDRYRNRQ